MERVASGISVVPVRTPTLPPATHTNTYAVGHDTLTLVDPASPYEDEQERLASVLRETGLPIERVLLTHHHHDHVSGVHALRDAFPDVVVAAHDLTIQRLAGRVTVDERLEDGDVIECGGVTLNALFTPGHAPGHLVFHDHDSGAVIAGDMVAGVGTILIDEVDGDLELYLNSLQAMRDLRPTVLLPAHGEPLRQADAVLAFYVAHRHQRTEQVRAALDEHGAMTAHELVPHVYAELDPRAHPIAAVQIGSHLRWMLAHGVVTEAGSAYRLR